MIFHITTILLEATELSTLLFPVAGNNVVLDANISEVGDTKMLYSSIYANNSDHNDKWPSFKIFLHMLKV